MLGGPKAMRSYENAERGLTRVNKQIDVQRHLLDSMHNRWLLMMGALTAAAPLLLRVAGAATQLASSLVMAAGGAGVIGGGAIGAFIVGLGSVAIAAKGVATDLKEVSKAQDAYTKVVQQYGAQSKQAAEAQKALNRELKDAPKGSLELLNNVKALGKEWKNATREARTYIVQTANYAVQSVRGRAGPLAAMVNQNVGAVAGVSRGMIDRLLSRENLGTLARISQGFRRDLPPAADALTNIVLSVGRLVAVAQPFVHDFLVAFDRWTRRLNIATHDTEYLRGRMKEMVEEFRQWARLLGATWRLLMAVVRGATRTHDAVRGITSQFNEWTRWLNQNPVKVARFFRDSKQGAQDIGNALVYVVRLFNRLAIALDPLWQSLRTTLGAVSGPLLDLLVQVARTLSLIGQGLGSLGGPLTILLRTLGQFFRIINWLLQHIPALGTLLAAALTIAGIARMKMWMERFIVGVVTAIRSMTTLTGQTNAAAAATERLALASRGVGGGGIVPVGGARGGGGGGGGGPIIVPGARGGGAVEPVLAPGETRLPSNIVLPRGVEPPAPATGGRFFGRLRGFGGRMGATRFARAAGPAGIAALIGTTALSMAPSRFIPGGRTTQGVLSGAATGAAVGAMAGSVIPGLGTGIGALGGAIVGGGLGFLTRPRGGGGVGGEWGAYVGGGLQRNLAHDIGGPLGGVNPRTAFQISGQLGTYNRYIRTLRGHADEQTAALREQLQAQRDLLRTTLPGVQAEETHRQRTRAFGFGQNLMRGFNVIAPEMGATRGMEFVRRQAMERWKRLGPEGRKVLADGLLSWVKEMERANPALKGQADKMREAINARLDDIAKHAKEVGGKVYTGTKREWQNIAIAMASPVEQARQSINTNLTAIQQQAVGALQAMGFTVAQARTLVGALETGGSRGALAQSITSGTTSQGAVVTLQPGGAQAASRHGGQRGGPKNNAVRGGGTSLQPGIQSVANTVLGMFPGLSITSALRPGDTGSYHSVGEAVDLAGPPGLMSRAARWIRRNLAGNLLEGIHNTGLSIKNGAVVPASFWGAQTWAGHADHIHLAAGPGGLGAQGNVTPMAAGTHQRVRMAQITPGPSGLGGLPGLLTDTATSLVAAATTRKLNRMLRGTSTPAAAAGVLVSGNVTNLGKRMAAERGWTGGQWNALYQLWQHESGWNPMARNASSGAFGIPQALPASKMGPDAVAGSAAAQIAWGLNYIAGRYGNPANAWATWQQRSPHWYGDGGHFVTRRPQLIGVGERGAEEVSIRPLGPQGRSLGRGGINVSVTIQRIDATGSPGRIREVVRGEIRDAIADVATELDRVGFVPEGG